jgi:hypothetical protein
MMRADRRIYGRASALPLHVLLAAKASPPRALLAHMTRVAIQGACSGMVRDASEFRTEPH